MSLTSLFLFESRLNTFWMALGLPEKVCSDYSSVKTLFIPFPCLDSYLDTRTLPMLGTGSGTLRVGLSIFHSARSASWTARKIRTGVGVGAGSSVMKPEPDSLPALSLHGLVQEADNFLWHSSMLHTQKLVNGVELSTWGLSDFYLSTEGVPTSYRDYRHCSLLGTAGTTQGSAIIGLFGWLVSSKNVPYQFAEFWWPELQSPDDSLRSSGVD